MVVMPINQRNPHIFLCKLLGKTYAAESGTDNDNMFLICHNTPLLIFNSEKNHIVGSFSPFEEAYHERLSPHEVHNTTFYKKFNRIFPFGGMKNDNTILDVIAENYHKDSVCFACRIRCSMMRRRIISSTAPTRIPPFSPAQYP